MLCTHESKQCKILGVSVVPFLQYEITNRQFFAMNFKVNLLVTATPSSGDSASCRNKKFTLSISNPGCVDHCLWHDAKKSWLCQRSSFLQMRERRFSDVQKRESILSYIFPREVNNYEHFPHSGQEIQQIYPIIQNVVISSNPQIPCISFIQSPLAPVFSGAWSCLHLFVALFTLTSFPSTLTSTSRLIFDLFFSSDS
jgi:hypothetical protein